MRRMISDVMQRQIKNLFESAWTDVTEAYNFATLDVDSAMIVNKQLSYCQKIQ